MARLFMACPHNLILTNIFGKLSAILFCLTAGCLLQLKKSLLQKQEAFFLSCNEQTSRQNKKRKRWLLASLASAPLLALAGHSVSR